MFRIAKHKAYATPPFFVTIDPGPVHYSTDFSGKVFFRTDEEHFRLP